MRWILTGGAGFIGSAFLSKLNACGVTDILVVDNLGSTDKWKNLVGKRFSDVVSIESFHQRLDSAQGVLSFGPVTHVAHIGASSATTVRDGDYLLENNYRFTRTLAENCIRSAIYLQYASSAATYGDGELGFNDDEQVVYALRPLNMYGYSKQLVDEWAVSTGAIRSMVGLKFFNVFGPNEYHKGEQKSLVAKAYEQISADGTIRLFKSYHPQYKDGESLRDFVYVRDCVEVMWWLAQHPEISGLYNVATGKARSWNDLAKSIFQALSLPPKIEYIDMPLELRDRYQYFSRASMEKLQSTGCPITFRPLENAIEDYVKNFLQHGLKTL